MSVRFIESLFCVCRPGGEPATAPIDSHKTSGCLLLVRESHAMRLEPRVGVGRLPDPSPRPRLQSGVL